MKKIARIGRIRDNVALIHKTACNSDEDPSADAPLGDLDEDPATDDPSADAPLGDPDEKSFVGDPTDALDDDPSMGALSGSDEAGRPYASRKVVPTSRALTEDLLEQYRVDQSQADFDAPKVRAIRARKPGRSWIRVHPEADLRRIYYLVEHDGSWYLVVPTLYAELKRSISERVLVVCVTSAGEVFVWPMTTSGDWYTSAARAASAAQSSWVAVFAGDGSYEYMRAPGGALANLEPVFPESSVWAIVAEAFDGRVIETLDHEVARKCLGLEP
jgi:hypothetical protein